MPNFEAKKQLAQDLLKIHYGFENFRQGQEKAIDNILAGKNIIVIMPTGGGKSLIYQLPSLVLDGTTIVISPLIALMKDQVDNLNQIGIPATFINSSLTQIETEERLMAIQNGYYKLLYIAPERFYNHDFVAALSNIKISLFAIDEAHCISQWGHDFRPSYTKLHYAIQALGKPIVVALTATATPEVRTDIVRQLKLENPEVILTGFARPNLKFSVIQAHEADKIRLILETTKRYPGQAGIIYTGTRGNADKVAQILLKANLEAAVYHAGMLPHDRKRVQEDFMRNQVQIVVATNAFGLGIDKRNIRFVIHYDMPGNVEAYYQEAGRAGRDMQPSSCLLLHHPRDRYLREFFIQGDNPPPEAIIEVYEILLERKNENNTVLITYAELASLLSQKLPDMAIGTCLKILERERYLSRPHDKVSNAYLRFLKNTDDVLAQISPRAKTQIHTIQKLASYFADRLYKGFNFSPEEIASNLELQKNSLMRILRGLADAGFIQYNPPFKGTEIKILKISDPDNLEIDFKALKEKSDKAYDKLQQFEKYIYHFDCRQDYILKYFGDEKSYKCGQCDNCLISNGQMKKVNFLDSQTSFKQKSTKPKTGMTQLETLDLFQDGLSIDEIAATRELKPETIISHLAYLIEKGKLKAEEIHELVSQDKRDKIQRAITKVGSSDYLKPIKEELDDEDISYGDIKLVVAGIR